MSKEVEKIIDEACSENPTKERWDAYVVGYLAEWVYQLQQDKQMLIDEREDLKIDRERLLKQQQEWWEQQDQDEQFIGEQK